MAAARRWTLALSTLTMLVLVGPAHAEISQTQAKSIGLAYATGQVQSTQVESESRNFTNATSEIVPVYRVAMHGQFVYTRAHPPQGRSLPEGKLLEIFVNRSSGQVEYVHLGEPTTSASTARVRRHHAKARAAWWGSEHCELAQKHCYALSTWVMSGSEQVEGLWIEVNTSNMNVPENSFNGAFADDEAWLSWASHPTWWLEIGQSNRESCCGMKWFWAGWNAGGYFERYESAVTGGTWNYYFIKAIGNKNWCYYIGLHAEVQIACAAGWATYSTELEDGAEVASENEPENAGEVVTSYAALKTGEWRTWNKDALAANNHMCVSRYAPENYPGNINYGTC